RRKFYALRFTTRERGAALSEPYIAKTDIKEGHKPVGDGRHVAEKTRGFIDRHVEHLGDIASFVSDLEGFTIVAFAAANLALDVNIGQKMHLDLDQPASFAVLT